MSLFGAPPPPLGRGAGKGNSDPLQAVVAAEKSKGKQSRGHSGANYTGRPGVPLQGKISCPNPLTRIAGADASTALPPTTPAPANAHTVPARAQGLGKGIHGGSKDKEQRSGPPPPPPPRPAAAPAAPAAHPRSLPPARAVLAYDDVCVPSGAPGEAPLFPPPPVGEQGNTQGKKGKKGKKKKKKTKKKGKGKGQGQGSSRGGTNAPTADVAAVPVHVIPCVSTLHPAPTPTGPMEPVSVPVPVPISMYTEDTWSSEDEGGRVAPVAVPVMPSTSTSIAPVGTHGPSHAITGPPGATLAGVGNGGTKGKGASQGKRSHSDSGGNRDPLAKRARISTRNANSLCPRDIAAPVRQQHRPSTVASEPIKKPDCKFYIAGACRRGDDCNFSHDCQVEKKEEVCKFFASGTCRKGDDCPYIHSGNPGAARVSSGAGRGEQAPCRYYYLQNGSCRDGEQCPFSHTATVSHEDLQRMRTEFNQRFDHHRTAATGVTVARPAPTGPVIALRPQISVASIQPSATLPLQGVAAAAAAVATAAGEGMGPEEQEEEEIRITNYLDDDDDDHKDTSDQESTTYT